MAGGSPTIEVSMAAGMFGILGNAFAKGGETRVAGRLGAGGTRIPVAYQVVATLSTPQHPPTISG